MVATHIIAICCSGIAVALLYPKFGFPRASAGLASIAIAGIGGLGPMFFKKDPGPVQMDERDTLIRLRAACGGFALSYLLFGILCMGIWWGYRAKSVETISINILPCIFGAAGITFFLSNAIIILFLYGREEKG
jgi:hypothetical protein